MPGILRRFVVAKPLLLLSLLLLLISFPGGQTSLSQSEQSPASAAAFFSVNSTGDGPDSNLADGVCNDGTGACTLRAAIQQANTTAGDDTLVFDISLNNHPMTLNTALPDITGNLNFSGNGSSLLTVQRSAAAGTPDFRIFNISSGTTVTITGLTITNGRAVGQQTPASSGGGILNSGTLTVNLCAVSGNFASSGIGGAIHNLNTLTVSNSMVSGNTGGGIANNIFGGVTTNATVRNSVISGNTGGPGLHNNAVNTIANLTVSDSTISGNTNDNVAGGGGIFVGAGSFESRANLIVKNSTISGNTASAGRGGGIYSAAVFGNAQTTITVINSTITGNTSSTVGGGISHFSSGGTALAEVVNSTIAANSAGSNGGGILADNVSGTMTFSLRNSIVANNTSGGTGTDLSGDFDSQDYNLIKDTSGATLTGTTTHNITGLDPLLAPLGNYGGPTKTMPPLPPSPAIDKGDAANLPVDTFDADGDGNTVELLPVDQRGVGFPRLINGLFDIGAVETNYQLTAIGGSGQSTPINTAFPLQLKAMLTESALPISEIPVTFTPPASGPSAAVSGGSIVNTDANGLVAVTVTANEIIGGPYNVVASVGAAVPSLAFSLTNLIGPTTTTMHSSVNPSDFGQSVTFTATVTSPSGVPTGTVQFIVDGSAFGAPVTLSPSGVAAITALSLGAGVHSVSAEYSGAANFSPSSVSLPTQVVLPSLTVNDVSITEGDSGTKTAGFTVSLSTPSNVQVTVNFATANGTAAAGSDYQATSGTVTFNPGQTTQPVNVTINSDISFEANETFQVNLSSAVNASINDPQGVGTILNDDAQGGFISLSQSSYGVGESDGSITITVNRTNDISAAATVDYATAGTTVIPCSTINHLASSRCDFTSAVGTLRFAAGESSKTFIVLISQDNYVEGQEALTISLSNPTGGAVFATPSSAPLTITDDASEPAANPVDDANVFVRQHYHDFLNREGDGPGIAFWTNQITECQQPGATCSAEVRRINVSGAFFLSIEFQETGYLVYLTYLASYGNTNGPVPVRFSEFLPDTQQIQKGVVFGQPPADAQLEANRVAFFLDFVSRARFTTAYPTTMTPAEFVDALFLKAGVTPSASDRTAAINEFGGAANTANTANRAKALRRVAENATLRQQESNRAFVLMQYFGYLRRDPNEAPEQGLNFDGYNFWLGKLNEFNGNFVNAEMVKAFLVSGEYRHRYGQ